MSYDYNRSYRPFSLHSPCNYNRFSLSTHNHISHTHYPSVTPKVYTPYVSNPVLSNLHSSYRQTLHSNYPLRTVRINDPEIESKMDEETLALKHIVGVDDWNNLVEETRKEITPLKADYSTISNTDLYSKEMKLDIPKSPKSSHRSHHRSLSYDNVRKHTHSEKKNGKNVLKYMDKDVVILKDTLPTDFWNNLYDEAEREMNKNNTSEISKRDKYINDPEIERCLDKCIQEMKYEMTPEEWNNLIKETRKDIKYKEHMKDYGMNSVSDYKDIKEKKEKNDKDDDCQPLLKPSNPIYTPNANISEREKMSRMRSNSVRISRTKYIDGVDVDNNMKNSVVKCEYTLKPKIDPNKSKIIKFYYNKYKSEPENVYIEDIIGKWKGDYYKLEIKHGYIQWIFPLYERGLNFLCPSITVEEVEYLKNDVECMNRMDILFEMMLDFYGMKLFYDKQANNINKVVVVRSDKYTERYNNMLIYQHNFLRITRILNCLDIFCKYEQCNAFLNHLIYEIYVTKYLNKAKYSCEGYWMKFSKDFKNYDIKYMTREDIIMRINDNCHK